MIEFKLVEPKKYIFKCGDQERSLELITSTITNKYNIITDFIENLSEHFGEEFDKWFLELFDEYQHLYAVEEAVEKGEINDDLFDNNRYACLEKNIPKIHYYVDTYIETIDKDYSKYVNMKKVKKGSILFTENEIMRVMTISHYLKIYSIFFNSTTKLNVSLHKKIYNKLIQDSVTDNIVSKLYNVVKTKTFRYNLTDKYMWDYLKVIQSKSIDSYVIEIFNFIMNQILILCEDDKNPIVYFVSVIDESVKWFLRSVYKESIAYDDSISTEDIHSLNTDNLITYAYNESLGKLKTISINHLTTKLQKLMENKFIPENDFDELNKNIHNRIKSVEFIAPISEYISYPLLSKALKIPYEHFRTISAEDSTFITAYMRDICKAVFGDEYSSLFELMDYYTRSKPILTSTYKMKSATEHYNKYNEYQNFFGFKSASVMIPLLGHFIGRLSRCKYVNIYTGEERDVPSLTRLELDVSYYFNRFFAGDMEKEIEKISNIIFSQY